MHHVSLVSYSPLSWLPARMSCRREVNPPRAGGIEPARRRAPKADNRVLVDMSINVLPNIHFRQTKTHVPHACTGAARMGRVGVRETGQQAYSQHRHVCHHMCARQKLGTRDIDFLPMKLLSRQTMSHRGPTVSPQRPRMLLNNGWFFRKLKMFDNILHGIGVTHGDAASDHAHELNVTSFTAPSVEPGHQESDDLQRPVLVERMPWISHHSSALLSPLSWLSIRVSPRKDASPPRAGGIEPADGGRQRQTIQVGYT